MAPSSSQITRTTASAFAANSTASIDVAANRVPTAARREAEPALPHWTRAYVGLPYIMGVGECGHRAALVWREVFGFEVEAAPAFGDMGAAQSLIRAALDTPAWSPVLVPAEGDAVIMGKGSLLAHVGVWVEPGLVLHCPRAHGMVLTPEDDLESQGFRVASFFQRRTVVSAPAAGGPMREKHLFGGGHLPSEWTWDPRTACRRRPPLGWPRCGRIESDGVARRSSHQARHVGGGNWR